MVPKLTLGAEVHRLVPKLICAEVTRAEHRLPHWKSVPWEKDEWHTIGASLEPKRLLKSLHLRQDLYFFSRIKFLHDSYHMSHSTHDSPLIDNLVEMFGSNEVKSGSILKTGHPWILMVLYQHELSADVKRIITDLNCKNYSNWFRLGQKRPRITWLPGLCGINGQRPPGSARKWSE